MTIKEKKKKITCSARLHFFSFFFKGTMMSGMVLRGVLLWGRRGERSKMVEEYET